MKQVMIHTNEYDGADGYVFSPSEKAINAALDTIVEALDKYVVTPLLGPGPKKI